jgi:ribosome-binding protein aMBF1 (putative translation factor)
MSDINKDVGFNIRRMHEEKGFSQEKLAALLCVIDGNVKDANLVVVGVYLLAPDFLSG